MAAQFQHADLFETVAATVPDRVAIRADPLTPTYTRTGDTQPDCAAVYAFLGNRLAGYKVPKALVRVDLVVRSPAGKRDYRWAKEVAASA